MTMKNDAKFEDYLTCRFKIDMGNLLNFDQSTWKSENWDFDGILLSKVYIVWAKKVQMGSFWAKYILFELKKYRWVIFHNTEEWYKTW